MVIVLQFAVICRIDDRELWTPARKVSVECPAIDETFRLMEENSHNGVSEPIRLVHEAARQIVIQRADNPSNLSDLLDWLSQIVSRNRISAGIANDELDIHMGMPVLPIRINDLKNIQQAINTMHWRDEEYACTTSEAYESYKSGSRGQELPSAHDLKGHFSLAHK